MISVPHDVPINAVTIKHKNGITSRTEQMNIIENLNLPKSIKKILIENNNNGAYQLLSVDNFEGYISNYLAGVMLNSVVIISFSLSFAFFFFIKFNRSYNQSYY